MEGSAGERIISHTNVAADFGENSSECVTSTTIALFDIASTGDDCARVVEPCTGFGAYYKFHKKQKNQGESREKRTPQYACEHETLFHPPQT
jgi:hypothetical protein